MSRALSLETRLASGPLAGVRLRFARWPYIQTIAGTIFIVAFMVIARDSMFMIVALTLGAGFTMWTDAARKYLEGKESLRDAIAVFHLGNAVGAERALVDFLRVRRFKPEAMIALVHLGLTLMRTLRFAEAVDVFETANRLDRGSPIAAKARAYLVIASIGANNAVAARAWLDTWDREAADSAARAQLALARALVAFRSADPASSMALLAEKRPLLDNMLTGNDAALADALEAAAYATTPSADGNSSSSSVLVDPEARAFVLHLVPECAPFVVDE